VAHAARPQPHEHLPGTGRGELDVVADAKRRTELLEDRGPDPQTRRIQLFLVSPEPRERRRQKVVIPVATPAAPAAMSAFALVFGLFVSGSILGAALFALRLSTRLPTVSVNQPTAAFLRLKTPTRRLYPAEGNVQTRNARRVPSAPAGG
jgi:hypothetical protein